MPPSWSSSVTSCGYCTPCRVGNGCSRRGLDKVLAGRGEPADLVQFEEVAGN
ncbi:MAG: hypothetical protein IPF66_06820 [Holophagales bacterium]|nr:hypothetical protein [Holophagales bacterium]